MIELALVEADARGNVISRRPVVSPGEVFRTPFFAWFPEPFGLRVDGDAVYVGWSLERRNSEVYRIARDTGIAALAWRGRGRYTGSDTEPAEVGHALHVLHGELAVVGGIYEYAAVAPGAGFIAHRGATTRTPDAFWRAAGDDDTLVVAQIAALERFDGALTPLAPHAPDRIAGLAFDGANILLITSDALYTRRF